MQPDLIDKQVDEAPRNDSIDRSVKMIIWDLDDTIWNGILAEGQIELIEERANVVKTLAKRGIISSVVSKNDYHAAKNILKRADLWEYFVFPSISYDPKGKRVTDIIQKASLRPEDVLFIDDNILNREEVRFFNPGIMLAHPDELIPVILSHPRFAGKPDLELKRLKQYHLLQRKTIEREKAGLSNEDFLRSSGIKISFDFNVEANFDRIIDLVNRANQLNYTKIRLSTPTDIEALRSSFNEYGISAASISCSDRYGDYGIIGFYVLKRTEKEFKLIHFVFSCRTMNMGIEQFVYRYLGEPKIAIVPDVAYAFEKDKTIDWISVSGTNITPGHAEGRKGLLLVGGCELLQLAAYCSSNRTEFVNKIIVCDGDEYKVRYDDPYFFITDRKALQRSHLIKQLAAWTYDDTILLDRRLSEAEIIILGMRAALRHLYLITEDDIRVRMERSNTRRYLRNRPAWFNENFRIVDIPTKARLVLIKDSFDWVSRHTSPEAIVFIIGAATAKSNTPIEQAISGAYNNWCSQYCQANTKFRFVDVDNLVQQDQIIEDQHLTPAGYQALSIFINDELKIEKQVG